MSNGSNFRRKNKKKKKNADTRISSLPYNILLRPLLKLSPQLAPEQQQEIRVEVIPGITSASGIAAELGVPLTHRGIANSVRFLTGHSRNGGSDPLYVAENAAYPDLTLVVYMGLSTLPALVPKLMSHGLPA